MNAHKAHKSAPMYLSLNIMTEMVETLGSFTIQTLETSSLVQISSRSCTNMSNYMLEGHALSGNKTSNIQWRRVRETPSSINIGQFQQLN